MWDQRAGRARLLAERYSASREILNFYAGLADWQGLVRAESFDSLKDSFPSLLDLITRTGPPALAKSASHLNTAQFGHLVQDYWDAPGTLSPMEFFARAVLQPYAGRLPSGLDCPWCRYSPQVGCLRPQADGLAFELVCALCLRRHSFPRARCPGCKETSETKIASFTAPEFPQLRLQACDACKGYLLVVDLSRDIHAIPEVDELAGLPLDIWAQEHGYHKLQRNLAGI